MLIEGLTAGYRGAFQSMSLVTTYTASSPGLVTSATTTWVYNGGTPRTFNTWFWYTPSAGRFSLTRRDYSSTAFTPSVQWTCRAPLPHTTTAPDDAPMNAYGPLMTCDVLDLSPSAAPGTSLGVRTYQWSVNPHHLPGHAWVCIGVAGETRAELCWASDQAANVDGFMAFGQVQP